MNNKQFHEYIISEINIEAIPNLKQTWIELINEFRIWNRQWDNWCEDERRYKHPSTIRPKLVASNEDFINYLVDKGYSLILLKDENKHPLVNRYVNPFAKDAQYGYPVHEFKDII